VEESGGLSLVNKGYPLRELFEEGEGLPQSCAVGIIKLRVDLAGPWE